VRIFQRENVQRALIMWREIILFKNILFKGVVFIERKHFLAINMN